MKKIIPAIVAFISVMALTTMMNGCTDKKSAQDDAMGDSLSTDSVTVDDIEEFITETPMPRSAAELFDDFFFNFAGSSKMQLRSIVFPLPVTTDGNAVNVEKAQWKTERFFMHQPLYTLFFDNYRQMSAQRDTSVNKATVERINLDASRVEQFHFDRVHGEWFMTSITNTDIADNQNASFYKFYQRFVTDSLFQKASVGNPLEFSGPDPDDELSTMDGLLLPEQWSSFAPPLPKGTIYNIIYGAPSAGSNQKIMLIQGISNGFQNELVFQKKSGKWQLVRLQI